MKIMAPVQEDEIQISGWYVVRSSIGTTLVLRCGVGSQVPEIVDGPFPLKSDAAEAFARVWKP
jgi:hypothetical protein